MRLLACLLTAATICLAPAVSQAQLTPITENFESIDPLSPSALSDLGFIVYGNVYTATGAFVYGYGTFPAPNASSPGIPSAFSRVASGEGGATQGLQQIGVFSDYENTGHAGGFLIESNVFIEQVVTAGDVGSTWYFRFDAKYGDIKPDSTEAIAFIKTISPAPDYFLTNFQQMRISGVREDGTESYLPNPDWNRYQLALEIVPGLVGSFLQIGFVTTTTYYAPSVVYYDNLEWSTTPEALGLPRDGGTVAGVRLSVIGNPAIGSAPQRLSFTTPETGPVGVRIFDLKGSLVSTILDRELEAGTHEASWDGRGSSGQMMPPGVYFAQIVAGSEKVVAKLVRTN